MKTNKWTFSLPITKCSRSHTADFEVYRRLAFSALNSDFLLHQRNPGPITRNYWHTLNVKPVYNKPIENSTNFLNLKEKSIAYHESSQANKALPLRSPWRKKNLHPSLSQEKYLCWHETSFRASQPAIQVSLKKKHPQEKHNNSPSHRYFFYFKHPEQFKNIFLNAALDWLAIQRLKMSWKQIWDRYIIKLAMWKLKNWTRKLGKNRLTAFI